ncbi:Neuroligin-4, Y-linked [Folsomia candida]|uniref:Neuroligin-4, Y-linked n=1 Tax=Folsomia candida TaxID=158441 RepID=A0A226EHG8_FOLCA|nr:Neuroligin-4, Y-linked [Folsomia candida]
MTMDAISWLSSGFVQSPIHLNLKWLTLLLLYWVSVGGQVNGIVINIRKLGNVQGPPEHHNGWNSTLDASRMGANCLQPTARGRTSEDCLYLNVWTPQYASGRNALPVVIFIGGDLYTSFDSSLYSGAELASMNLIVVTFNYRLNVYGFFSTEDVKAGGNMGLLDQYLAIEWVHENIDVFGGDPTKVTLMGHGSGAAAVMMHMTSPRAVAGRFHRVILMSGSSLAPWAMGYRVKEASQLLAKEAGCSTSGTDAILNCLRYLDVNRITQAYYRVIDHYNGTDVFGPVVDNFLPVDLQYVGRSPWEALERGEFPKIPVITGISAKDGLLMIRRKSQLYRLRPFELKQTFETELIPQLLERSRLGRNWEVVKEVIKFAFITGAANETGAIMDQMLDFFTESMFLAPHVQTAQFLSQYSNPVYAYIFDQETPDPNLYTSSLNSTGAWHGSILLYLFGRTAFSDLIGRDLNGIESGVASRLQQFWSGFAITGTTQSRNLWSQWTKFTPTAPFHYWVRDGRLSAGYQPHRTAFWTDFLPRLNYLSGNSVYGNSLTAAQEYREGANPAYKSATWVLGEQEFTSRETSPEVTGSRSPLPSPSPHPSRSGRRPRTQDQGVTILY